MADDENQENRREIDVPGPEPDQEPPPEETPLAQEPEPPPPLQEEPSFPPAIEEPVPAPPLEEEVVKERESKKRVSSMMKRGDTESLGSIEGILGDDEGERGEEKTETEGGAPQAMKKKRKHSLSAHLQVEIIKKKLAQSKQAREERRGELEVHHQYLINQVSAHINLKAKEVEEFVIDSPVYFELMDKFLDKDGSKAIVFSYQLTDPPGPESGRPLLIIGAAKKEKIWRVLVSDGSDIPLKGTCMFFLRLNNENKVNMTTINEEIFFGALNVRDTEEPATVLETLYKCLQTTFLKYLKTNNTWVTIPDPETAAVVRHKFITSIDRYAEFLSDCRNDIISRLDLTTVCDMDEIYEKYLKTADDVMESSRNPEIVTNVEHIVILWCKNIEKVIALSKQMRKETDAMGPRAELAYWKVQRDKFMNFIQCLLQSKSRVLRRWKDVDGRVTDEFHEAKDNVRYMDAVEKFCEPLYQQDPASSMIPHINSMMYTIRTIHTTSRYYNSCEKVTALMARISNQMVAASRQYLTTGGTETIWTQDKSVMVKMLNKCLELYATYRGSYESTKAELETHPEGKHFNFSVSHIFGRFDQFCERLKKMYKFVHLSRIDGLDVISNRLNNLYKNILKKGYDALDFRKDDFDVDFVSIRNSIDEIQKSLEQFMDKSIENCPTAMHGVELLQRFRNLRNRCLDIEGKEWYLYQFYNNEITMLRNVYEAEKNNSPTPREFPPFSGPIAWSRHLYRRLERPMNHFKRRTRILDREDAHPIIKNFNMLSKKLILYELLHHDAFCKQCPVIYDSLEAPLLAIRGTIKQEMVLNFDPFFPQIIEETEIMIKLELEVPEIVQIVYFKQKKLYEMYEQMKALLDRFAIVRTKIPNDLALIFLPLVKRVEKSFMPGTSTINWTSSKLDEYFDYIKIHLDELEEIAIKVNDILTVRVTSGSK